MISCIVCLILNLDDLKGQIVTLYDGNWYCRRHLLMTVVYASANISGMSEADYIAHVQRWENG